jgi:putative addiction module killer protein
MLLRRWIEFIAACFSAALVVAALTDGLSATDRSATLDIVQCVNHSSHMIELVKSASFDRWLIDLKDVRARARIEVRIRRMSLGNPGDVKPVGAGVSEMRVDYGPGYRVYFMQRGLVVIVLLCGGEKSTQARDIARAKSIAAQWRD